MRVLCLEGQEAFDSPPAFNHTLERKVQVLLEGRELCVRALRNPLTESPARSARQQDRTIVP